MARESAFFALFLSSESAQFAQKWEYWVDWCFHCYVVFEYAQHKQWSSTYIHYFTFMGVQTQLLEIRISLGGSALFAM